MQARDVGTFTTAKGAWVPYMVLEWLDGKPLESMLEAERARRAVRGAAWPMQKAIALLEPVAAALDARAPPRHRPPRHQAREHLRPRRPRRDEMHVKVLDFGIAKVVQSAAEHGSFAQDRRAGDLVHAALRRARAVQPLARRDRPVDRRLRARARHRPSCSSAVPPLEGDDFIQLGMATADPKRRPTPRTLGVAITDALEAVFRKALAVKPDGSVRRPRASSGTRCAHRRTCPA